MRRSLWVTATALLASGAIAADMLPLKQGLYAPANLSCAGASNADIVNYWGGNSAIGVAQAECKIKKLSKNSNAFTIFDECRDLQRGDLIEGGPTVLIITSPTTFKMNGKAYRYCGIKRQS
jgi:hypothetical protein